MPPITAMAFSLNSGLSIDGIVDGFFDDFNKSSLQKIVAWIPQESIKFVMGSITDGVNQRDPKFLTPDMDLNHINSFCERYTQDQISSF